MSFTKLFENVYIDKVLVQVVNSCFLRWSVVAILNFEFHWSAPFHEGCVTYFVMVIDVKLAV